LLLIFYAITEETHFDIVLMNVNIPIKPLIIPTIAAMVPKFVGSVNHLVSPKNITIKPNTPTTLQTIYPVKKNMSP